MNTGEIIGTVLLCVWGGTPVLLGLGYLWFGLLRRWDERAARKERARLIIKEAEWIVYDEWILFSTELDNHSPDQ